MRARWLPGAAALLAAAACQTAPVVVQAAPGTAEPVGVAAAVSANPSEGLTENDWGGEVPQSKPAGDVSEGSMSDLE